VGRISEANDDEFNELVAELSWLYGDRMWLLCLEESGRSTDAVAENE